MAQLPLALALADHASFATFVTGSNSAAVQHLQVVAGGAPEILWLWGPAGCGKTHLQQAACRAATAAGKRAMYVSLATAGDAAILAGLEAVDLLALDDVERVAGDAAWEQALFVTFNEFSNGRGGLLLASAAPAAGNRFRLADLASRAAGAVSYRLQPLADADRVVALCRHAAVRGLDLERAAAEYLLHRVDRDMAGLGRWLDRLDRASLAEQRKLTIPFIRGLLEGGPGNGG